MDTECRFWTICLAHFVTFAFLFESDFGSPFGLIGLARVRDLVFISQYLVDEIVRASTSFEKNLEF